MDKIRVLLVEDSEADAALLIRELEKAGYSPDYLRVDTAKDLEKALEMRQWDIILCDYVIPGFGGLEALEQLRKAVPDLPAIIISGQIGEDAATDAMRAGARDYVLKDNLRRLAPAVRRELQESSARRKRRIIEEQLIEKTRELEVVREVERVKDEFLGLISHEMRNPLTILVGNLFILKTPEALPPGMITELADDAYRQATGLSAILENLLELARAQADRLQLSSEEVDLGHIITDTVNDIRKEDRHRINIEAAQDIPPVRGDPVRLKRVLFNLIDNAIKYSPDSGRVTVSAVPEGQEVLVGVHDKGIGIPAAQLKDLFKPFSRLKGGRERTGGTGLGLIVCQRLCNAQGGRIWVESEEGKGSSFYFTVPAVTEPEKTAGPD